MLTRRQMLKGVLGGAALVVTPAGLLLHDPEEPVVRRYWQVGADLRDTETMTSLVLLPIEGQPGFYRDLYDMDPIITNYLHGLIRAAVAVP